MKYLVMIEMNDGTIYYRGTQSETSINPNDPDMKPFNSIRSCRSERNFLQKHADNLKIADPYQDKNQPNQWWADSEIIIGTGHMMKHMKSIEIGEFNLSLVAKYAK